MYPNALENAEKVRRGLLLYFFLECGIIPKRWWCCHGACAYLFPILYINPFSPGATGDVICTVKREGPHLGKHEAWVQLGWSLHPSVYDSSCLITPSCHNWVFPCHLFIQTLIKQYSLMPYLLRALGISIRWCWLEQLAFYSPSGVFPCPLPQMRWRTQNRQLVRGNLML